MLQGQFNTDDGKWNYRPYLDNRRDGKVDRNGGMLERNRILT